MRAAKEANKTLRKRQLAQDKAHSACGFAADKDITVVGKLEDLEAQVRRGKRIKRRRTPSRAVKKSRRT